MDWLDFHSANLNGPAPTGARPYASLPALLYASGLRALTPVPVIVNMNAADGDEKRMRMVDGSTASTTFEAKVNGPFGFAFSLSSSAASSFETSMPRMFALTVEAGWKISRSRFHLATLESQTVPSWNLTPCWSFSVMTSGLMSHSEIMSGDGPQVPVFSSRVRRTQLPYNMLRPVDSPV